MYARLLTVLSLALLISTGAEARKPLLITNVTIIDPYDGSRRPNASVLVEKGRITRIGQAMKAPRGAETFDATGKFLLPGLWDMRVHAGQPGQLRLYIANGVTAVRALGKTADLAAWRKQVAAGSLVGPQMFIAGADFVQVPDRAGRAEFLSLAADAKKRSLKLTGPVPYAMGAAEAGTAGLRLIDHLEAVIAACTPHEGSYRKGLTSWNDLLQSWNQSRADAVLQSLRASNSWQVPALVVKHTAAMTSFTPIRSRLRYATRAQRAEWAAPDNPFFLNRTPDRLQTAMLDADVSNIVAAQMRDMGVQVMTGSDADGAPLQVPGFSLHDELHLLVDAGYSPMEAMKSATVLPARFFGVMADYGPIGPGRVADLLLVDADPIEDIKNVHLVHAVIASGRLFDRDDLDAMLIAVEQENE